MGTTPCHSIQGNNGSAFGSIFPDMVSCSSFDVDLFLDGAGEAEKKRPGLLPKDSDNKNKN